MGETHIRSSIAFQGILSKHLRGGRAVLFFRLGIQNKPQVIAGGITGFEPNLTPTHSQGPTILAFCIQNRHLLIFQRIFIPPSASIHNRRIQTSLLRRLFRAIRGLGQRSSFLRSSHPQQRKSICKLMASPFLTEFQCLRLSRPSPDKFWTE
ncbi:hypothetical protein BDBG_02860 [Blastomyces gilchristii SLH14081]|uniref:Uncharacterized protein n=1 Tax=Blastomyces gilchristii (strain SLH14081) TaxID=559298 RepID=A0A179UHS8_BLAGS|nr:uncharacterized protein BDBG_02860 [Blastomyces gilchristii SLH14081]OAT06687.1 hypothetical protein BDBG_02860 [Blastomyces gilchristii SLH14081]